MVKEKNLLKIGIVGAGFIVQTSHLPAISKSSKCFVAGVFDINEENAQRAVKLYINLLKKNKNPLITRALKETQAFNSVEEMIKNVDIVDIATPPKFHLDILRRAVKAGRHITCEKPLARNWIAVKINEDMLTLAKENK
ncbi:MAG: Gfo/Idh/MocA family protein, partial [Promethearchaeota archaeon]